MYSLFWLLHLFGAAIWLMSFVFLLCSAASRLWHRRPLQALTLYRQAYRRWGLAALMIQLITGFWLVTLSVLDLNLLFTQALSSPIIFYWLKLLLVLAIFALAFNARFRLIPRMNTENQVWLPALLWHFGGALLASMALLGIGLFVHFGR